MDHSLPTPASVYILTGQSNALGTTCLEPPPAGPGSDPADQAARLAWANIHATNTGFPPVLYDGSAGRLAPLQVQAGEEPDPTFWGPEYGFVRALHAAGTTRVVIIKVARGGGGNGYWSRTAYREDPGRGHMWGCLSEVIKQAITALRDAGEPFQVRGLLYLQGESNSHAEAVLSGERLAELIDGLDDFLRTLDPDAIRAWRTAVGEIAASQSTAERTETVRQHALLAAQRSDVVFVPTRDLPLKADGLHFGRDAKLEIGRRFAVALNA